jgi:hypothetical protein
MELSAWSMQLSRKSISPPELRRARRAEFSQFRAMLDVRNLLTKIEQSLRSLPRTFSAPPLPQSDRRSDFRVIARGGLSVRAELVEHCLETSKPVRRDIRAVHGAAELGHLPRRPVGVGAFIREHEDG